MNDSVMFVDISECENQSINQIQISEVYDCESKISILDETKKADCSSSEDLIIINDDEDETDELSSTRINYEAKKSWSNQEVLNLVYLKIKFGNHWSMILSEYKNYFASRSVVSLKLKYASLEENAEELENLIIQANTMKEPFDLNLKENKIEQQNDLFQKKERAKYATKKWSQIEVNNLVFLVKKSKNNWPKKLKKYQEFLPNRSVKALTKKYKALKADEEYLEDLKSKVHSFQSLDVKSKEELPLNKSKNVSNTKSSIEWTHEECLYLVHGVKQLGQDWKRILDLYREHFNEKRTCGKLMRKYFQIENDHSHHKFLLNEVASLLESI